MAKTREEKFAQLEAARQARRGKLPRATRRFALSFTKEDIAPHATQDEWNTWVGLSWEDWEEACFTNAVATWEVYEEELVALKSRTKKEG